MALSIDTSPKTRRCKLPATRGIPFMRTEEEHKLFEQFLVRRLQKDELPPVHPRKVSFDTRLGEATASESRAVPEVDASGPAVRRKKPKMSRSKARLPSLIDVDTRAPEPSSSEVRLPPVVVSDSDKTRTERLLRKQLRQNREAGVVPCGLNVSELLARLREGRDV